MLTVIAVLAMILKMIGDSSLVVGLWRRHFPQHRFTWLLFTMTGWVIFDSQRHMGMSLNMLFFGWIVVVNVVLLALTFTPGRGEGGTEGWGEYVAFVVALGSLLLLIWATPLVALLCTMVADMIGGAYSVRRAWRTPSREEATPWLWGTCGALLSMIAVGSFDWHLMLAPTYFFIFDFVMFALSKWRPLAVTAE